ncbi:MAG: hypothetical protein QM619_13585 [Micropruina sp.]|uniref:hypothetical protein n=1 Tax=Micropruina sp. TaxID=2737536 RepID=UPI0039E43E70
MEFDPKIYRDIGAAGAPPAEEWLLRRPETYLSTDRKPSLQSIHSECVLPVVGEAGSGKTTLIDLIEADAIEQGFLSVRLDFKNVPTLVIDMSVKEGILAVAEFITNAARVSVENTGLWNRFLAIRARLVLRNFSTPKISELKKKYPGLNEFPDERLLALDDVLAEVQRFDEENPRQYLTAIAVQHIRPSGHPVLILADDLEGVPTSLRGNLMRILSAIQCAGSLLFVAIRRENLHQLRVTLQSRRDEVCFLDSLPGGLFEIARIRNDGALRLCLEGTNPSDEKSTDTGSLGATDPHSLGDQRTYVDGIGEIDWNAAKARHKYVDDSLRNLEEDQFLADLTAKWLNGNVRNFLTLMVEVATTEPSQSGRSLGGSVSSLLLKKRAHPSLRDIFQPAVVPTQRWSYPFVFLPFRVLVYLRCRGGSISFDQMCTDFKESFGIEQSAINTVIGKFIEGDNNDGIGMPILLRRVERHDEGDQVKLLSCGEVFVDSFVYRCDYLSTLFDRLSNSNRPSMPSGMAASEEKLRKTVAVVEKIILPNFYKEHPYVDPNPLTVAPVTDEVRSRLEEYNRMFAFRHGFWFVGRLKDSIESYATKRGYRHIAEQAIQHLGDMESRLNSITLQSRRISG